MKNWIISAVVLAALSACGGGDDDSDTVRTATVYTANGAVSCGVAPGLTLAQMQSRLTTANIPVRRAACGNDGIARPAICGQPSGEIGIFQIAEHDVQRAKAAGFGLLSEVPQAHERPCG